MNKLDEIIENNHPRLNKDGSEYKILKKVALEFAKHILEEAAENAKLESNSEIKIERNGLFDIEINKQSITDTLNKYL